MTYQEMRENTKGKFRLVTHEGEEFELVEEFNTGEETLYNYLVSVYPPEFFIVAATDGMYRLYGENHVATIMAPKMLQRHCAGPVAWQLAYVVATHETVWPE